MGGTAEADTAAALLPPLVVLLEELAETTGAESDVDFRDAI